MPQTQLHGYDLTIATLPAMMLSTRQEINGSLVYSGLYIDYLNFLATDLNFTYTILEPWDGVYGSDFDGDGQWSGIIGMTQRGDIDIGLAPFTQTVERKGAVAYLEYLTYSGLAMLMKKPTNFLKYDFFAPFKPFSPELWTACAASIIFASVILWFLLHMEYFLRSKNWSCSLTLFRNCFRYISGSACAQGGEIPDKSSSIYRVLVSAIWLTFIILQATYIANLISYIAVTNASLPVNNLKELAEQNTYEIGVIKSSSHEILFRTATSGYFKQIWDKIQSDPGNLVSLYEGLTRVRNEEFIFVTEHFYLQLLLSGDCDLVLGQETFLPRYLGWITPKGWPFSEIFNDKITRLRESGILNVIFNRYSKYHLVCENKPEAIQLGLQSLRGLFTLLFTGCVVGFVVLIIENIFAFRINRHKKYKVRLRGTNYVK